MTPITIRIPGAIPGKARARVTRRGAFTPAKTAHWEAVVQAHAIQQAGLPRLSGPLSVALHVGVAIPESWSEAKRTAAISGRLRPTGKPDVSNYLKLVEDALNRILWADDSQIVTATVTKAYSAAPEAVLTVVPVA